MTTVHLLVKKRLISNFDKYIYYIQHKVCFFEEKPRSYNRTIQIPWICIFNLVLP